MDSSTVGLRVLREVAERGSFTAAAAALGYTQSAVSRQVAALESAARAQLFERRPDGVRMTDAGRVLLRHTSVALDALDAATREIAGASSEGGAVRLGAHSTAHAAVVPHALHALRRARPELSVTTREGTTPALVRAVRAGALDLAVIASAPPFRAPDAEAPPLEVETLAEIELLVAAPAHHPLAVGDTVGIEELGGQAWSASRSSGEETLLGAWPGLAGRPRVVHTARDWLTKLQLVAAGGGLTTVPATLAAVLPSGVRLLHVRGGPDERRRLLLARLPGPITAAAAHLRESLRVATADL